MKRMLLLLMLLAAPLLADDTNYSALRSVIVAYRPDLITVPQRAFLKAKIDEYTLKDIGGDCLKQYEIFIDADGNTWHAMWWSVQQFKMAGLTVTLAAVKAKLKESVYANRIKVAIADFGQAEALAESIGWHRPEE